MWFGLGGTQSAWRKLSKLAGMGRNMAEQNKRRAAGCSPPFWFASWHNVLGVHQCSVNRSDLRFWFLRVMSAVLAFLFVLDQHPLKFIHTARD